MKLLRGINSKVTLIERFAWALQGFSNLWLKLENSVIVVIKLEETRRVGADTLARYITLLVTYRVFGRVGVFAPTRHFKLPVTLPRLSCANTPF